MHTSTPKAQLVPFACLLARRVSTLMRWQFVWHPHAATGVVVALAADAADHHLPLGGSKHVIILHLTTTIANHIAYTHGRNMVEIYHEKNKNVGSRSQIAYTRSY